MVISVCLLVKSGSRRFPLTSQSEMGSANILTQCCSDPLLHKRHPSNIPPSMHTHTHTHTPTRMHTHIHSLWLVLSHTHSLSHAPSHTSTHTHDRTFHLHLQWTRIIHIPPPKSGSWLPSGILYFIPFQSSVIKNLSKRGPLQVLFIRTANRLFPFPSPSHLFLLLVVPCPVTLTGSCRRHMALGLLDGLQVAYKSHIVGIHAAYKYLFIWWM